MVASGSPVAGAVVFMVSPESATTRVVSPATRLETVAGTVMYSTVTSRVAPGYGSGPIRGPGAPAAATVGGP
ncbi:hypothetical protein GCM10027569_35760 [Flindersiella endophytica]